MELSFSMNTVLCVVGVMVVIYGWRFFNWVWLKPKKMDKFLREQGLNGNPYKFLYGDMKEMVQMTADAKLKPINLTDDIVPRVMPYLYNSSKTYGKGKNFYTWMGPRPFVHVTEPALIRRILANYARFQKINGGNPLAKLVARGLADVEAEQWAKHRKIINPVFHVEKLKHMVPAFYISCSDMINKWEVLTKERSCEVDVYPHLQTFTSDVISRTAFGSSYEEGRKIFELQKEQTELVMKALQSLYIPGSRFLPTKSNRRMKEIDREVRATINKIINKRITTTKAGKSSSDDLLGILLDSNYKEIKQQGNTNFGLTTEEVIQECKLFYFAGQETTANLLAWTMILLAQHTNWQDRARDEVLKVFGDRKPDIDGLNRLKVINMILQEVLRLYPAVIGLGRMIHEETTLGNITLPAGSFLQLHMMLLHYDNEMWGDDVKEFKPERFAEGVSKATTEQASYFPFGGGPRICIGQNFATLEAKLALCYDFKRFFPLRFLHCTHMLHILSSLYNLSMVLN
ncbi:unnamed protein product [Lactuca virosa]|uniref:Cytochrome P450 n=1 Tax=Lactuca virosa TaxID=75947 RepID=A0AAU9LIN2_9ASTR|nr:unnamed protein product [Lactuca virosa]